MLFEETATKEVMTYERYMDMQIGHLDHLLINCEMANIDYGPDVLETLVKLNNFLYIDFTYKQVSELEKEITNDGR